MSQGQPHPAKGFLVTVQGNADDIRTIAKTLKKRVKNARNRDCSLEIALRNHSEFSRLVRFLQYLQAHDMVREVICLRGVGSELRLEKGLQAALARDRVLCNLSVQRGIGQFAEDLLQSH